MIDRIRVEGGKKKILKFLKFNHFERNLIVDEICYSQSYFPRINGKLDFRIGPNDTVIDIGANVGIFSAVAANLASNGTVYAFEPVRGNFKRLEQNRDLNEFDNLIAENKGVSDRRKKADIYLVARNRGAHSIHKSKLALNKESIRGTESIECIALKDVFDQHKIRRCDFLKLDCEGEEFNILSNLPARYFARIDKISLEFHRPVVDEIELARYLIQQSFTVVISDLGSRHGMIFAKRKTKAH